MKNEKMKLVLRKYLSAARAAGISDQEFAQFIASLFANGILHDAV
jgi:hypothetical protein